MMSELKGMRDTLARNLTELPINVQFELSCQIARFDEAMDKLDRFMEDRKVVWHEV
jgi:hypothetical protein